MPQVRNTTASDIDLGAGGVVRAGRAADIAADDFASALRSPSVLALVNAGKLMVQHAKRIAPDDLEALREAARGDGRTTEARDARDQLESMGETW